MGWAWLDLCLLCALSLCAVWSPHSWSWTRGRRSTDDAGCRMELGGRGREVPEVRLRKLVATSNFQLAKWSDKIYNGNNLLTTVSERSIRATTSRRPPHTGLDTQIEMARPLAPGCGTPVTRLASVHRHTLVQCPASYHKSHTRREDGGMSAVRFGLPPRPRAAEPLVSRERSCMHSFRSTSEGGEILTAGRHEQLCTKVRGSRARRLEALEEYPQPPLSGASAG